MVKILRLMYKSDMAVLLSWLDDWPESGIIEKIWVKNDEKSFVVDELATLGKIGG